MSFCFIVLAAEVFGQMSFQKIYNSNYHNQFNKIIITADGGYALIGSIMNQGAGMNDILFLKTDSTGSIQWSKSYGALNDDFGISVIENTNSGYYILGYTQSFSIGNLTKDILIIKTDENGNIEWSKLFSGSDDDVGNDMLAIRNSTTNLIDEIIVAGFTKSYGQSQQSALSFAVDTSGNLTWSNCFSQNAEQNFNKVTQLKSGDLIFAGATTEPSNSNYDAYFVKTNLNGDMDWAKRIGGNGSEKVTDIAKFSGSSYIYIYGTATSGGSGGSDVMILIMSDSNSTYDSPVLVYGSPLNDFPVSAFIDTMGFFNHFVSGYTVLQTGTITKYGFFVFAHDNSGNLTYPGVIYGDTSSQNKCFSALIRRPWSNNIAEIASAGFTNGFGQTNGSGYFVKSHHSLTSCNQYPLTFQYDYFVPHDSSGSDSLSILLGTQNVSISINNLSLGENTLCFITGMEEGHSSEINFNIYPNPATSTIQLTLPEDLKGEVEIVNVMGERVLIAPLRAPLTPKREPARMEIDVSGLAKGVYVVRAGNENRKLVIE